ncbi:MFS transporter [Saccharomonospora piscinae]|uniref:MFS transporter n=1 Tax=Saccharomonospora piscinae TaxID=687388 RepID=UPI000464A1B5|nr:MFS transporter [Saccharomonospora piscinae]
MRPNPTAAGAREWTALAVLTLPALLLSIDNTVLVLALPELSADLRPSPTQQLWIMDSYGFLIAGFLVTMGALGDRVGRRRVLLTGAAAFGVASVVAAYSGSAEMLIAARMALGIAAATLMPSSLALLNTVFVDAKQRGLAVGVFIGGFMAGAALGPLVGGALLGSFWWGAVFLVNVPVMLLLLLVGPALLPEGRGSGTGSLDPLSVLLSLATVLPVVYGLKELATEPGVLAVVALLAGLVTGAVFVRRQRRLAEPLLDLRLLERPAVRAVVGLSVAVMLVQGGAYLLMGQFLQLVRGLTPWESGLVLVAPALALVAGSLLSPVLARRWRPGTVLACGLAVAAAGFAGLTTVDVTGSLTMTVVALAVAFGGMAPVGALGADLVLGSAPPSRAGGASSVVETAGELGIALGMAALGTVSAVLYRSALAPSEGAATLADVVADAGASPAAAALLPAAREALTGALATVAVGIAVLCVVLAAVVPRALRTVAPVGATADTTDTAADTADTRAE